MASERSYDVSTKVLSDQARLSLGELKAPANKEGVDALEAVGLDVPSFINDLGASTQKLQKVEAAQERAKSELLRELKEDRGLSYEGYRWLLRLQSRVRTYLAENPTADEYVLRNRFRFGKVKNAHIRTIVYELRVVLPELKNMLEELAGVGINEKFLNEGKKILKQLGIDREETEEARAEQEKLTREVREAEIEVSQLLRRLVLTDISASLEHPEAKRWFPLNIIAAEMGRIQAAHDAMEAPIPEESMPQDEEEQE